MSIESTLKKKVSDPELEAYVISKMSDGYTRAGFIKYAIRKLMESENHDNHSKPSPQ